MCRPQLRYICERSTRGAPASRRRVASSFSRCSRVSRSLSAEDREPARRELWVPTKHLDEVLRRHPNAVLLDRAQYEALIRDAGMAEAGRRKNETAGGCGDRRRETQRRSRGRRAEDDHHGRAHRQRASATAGRRFPCSDLPADVVMTKFDGSDVLLKESAARRRAGRRPCSPCVERAGTRS